MHRTRRLLLAFLILLASPVAVLPAAAQAQAATPAQQQAAGAFVSGLADQAFAVLRDRSISREQARGRFRELLRANFAIEETGLRLIRRYRAPNSPVQLTPQQVAAYRAALPDFLVNTYSDRLYDFATSQVTVIRTAPRGTRGDVDVITRITDPKGGRPIEAIWHVTTASGRPLIANIVVNGVNVALTQEADFTAYIDRNGFDALVDFMRRRT